MFIIYYFAFFSLAVHQITRPLPSQKRVCTLLIFVWISFSVLSIYNLEPWGSTSSDCWPLLSTVRDTNYQKARWCNPVRLLQQVFHSRLKLSYSIHLHSLDLVHHLFWSNLSLPIKSRSKPYFLKSWSVRCCNWGPSIIIDLTFAWKNYSWSFGITLPPSDQSAAYTCGSQRNLPRKILGKTQSMADAFIMCNQHSLHLK